MILLLILVFLVVSSLDLSGLNLDRLTNTQGNDGNAGDVFNADGETNNGNSANSNSPLYVSCVGKGTYVEVSWNQFRNGDHYLIPRSELTTMAAGTFLMFEGEQAKKGLHEILPVVAANGEFAPQVTNDGLKLYQASFWRYATDDEGCIPVDDLLMVFAQDKRDNWTSQGMRGNPIKVWVSDGAVEFKPSEDISLTDAQMDIVDANAETRCDADDAFEENPLGDPDSEDLVISQIGSSSCTTLLVRGDEAVYFTGARDGVRYRPAETRVFIVPTGWDEDDMRTFLKKEGITFSSLEPMS